MIEQGGEEKGGNSIVWDFGNITTYFKCILGSLELALLHTSKPFMFMFLLYQNLLYKSKQIIPPSFLKRFHIIFISQKIYSTDE